MYVLQFIYPYPINFQNGQRGLFSSNDTFILFKMNKISVFTGSIFKFTLLYSNKSIQTYQKALMI